jgi:5-methylthioadenosine/S-adenosylhomocysteine deaminase
MEGARMNGAGGGLEIRGAVVGEAAVDIVVRDGIIVALSPAVSHSPSVPRHHDGAGSDDPPRRILEAHGLHAFPSFRNAHTHVAMVLFRGYGDDMPLMEWLQTRIWPAEARLTEEHVYHGARLGILEMIRGGTTFFNEMYWHRPAIVQAVHDLGVRAVVGQTLIDLGDAALFQRQKDELVRLAREERTVGRVGLAAAPHSIYTVPFDVLQWIAGVAEEHGLLVHIHLSETAGEVERCVAEHGCRPAELLRRAGLVNDRLIAVHGQFLDDAELDLLGTAGGALVTNPAANLKLATAGIMRYRRARSAGVRVCLGTDGAASNNTLSMIESMKLAALLQKHQDADATTLPAPEALAMATRTAAAVFGQRGTLEVGAPADMVLMDFSGAATQPLHDPVSALVYAATAADVHTTICDGRVLMHARRIEICDEDEVIESARRAAFDVTR